MISHTISLLFWFTVAAPFMVFSQSMQFKIGPLFTDHLVLQQQSNAPVWGIGAPGVSVFVSASWGKKGKSIVQSDGRWQVSLKTPKAGGPYRISIIHEKDTIFLRNVLIGEVWLCSGQSNMEMPLEGWSPEGPIDNSAAEIQHASIPNIRFFAVDRSIALQPSNSCSGSWKECTPEAAAKFSATAFFFGKKLHRDLKVPIGLILSAWGGTPVQAWTSEEYITQYPEYSDFPSKLKQSTEEFALYTSWLSSHSVVDLSGRNALDVVQGLQFNDSALARVDNNDSSWKEMFLPVGWEQTEVGEFDGVVWFRKKIEVPRNWRNKELILEMGPIDDFDVTYVNGIRIGSHETGSPWNIKRVYSIPADIVTDTQITLAVRVIDLRGGGGFWGLPEQMSLHPKDGTEHITLTGTWKYLPIAEYRDSKIYLFDIESREFYNRPPLALDITAQVPTTLYNGMIAPLIPFAIKGVIWYQGESNTVDPEGYTTLFPLMIKNWRNDWKKDFPFYFVQIAPFRYSQQEHSERLREAQLQTLSLPNTGMAVTLDIGDPENIHPSNKTDVGERLARLALAKVYGKKIPYSGPHYKSMKIKNNEVTLTFDHAEGLKLTLRNGNSYFSVAGDDRQFRPAVVTVKGKKLILHSPEVDRPVAVRYAWDNVAEATLFNSAGLPASSFRTDDWK